jgi:hypothetical protein
MIMFLVHGLARIQLVKETREGACPQTQRGKLSQQSRALTLPFPLVIGPPAHTE